MAFSPVGEQFKAGDQSRFENMMKLLLFLEAELQLKEEIIDLLLVGTVQYKSLFLSCSLCDSLSKIIEVKARFHFEGKLVGRIWSKVIHLTLVVLSVLRYSFSNEEIIRSKMGTQLLFFFRVRKRMWFVLIQQNSFEFFASRKSFYRHPSALVWKRYDILPTIYS